MNKVSERRLRAYVYELTGKIGEHDIFHPDALCAAEAYISEDWR
ncbi:hypothetical protein [Methylomarinum vadi]|nr:hypothetical protein [Methylomarinum vadi]